MEMPVDPVRGWVHARDSNGCGPFKWRCVRNGDVSDSPPPLVQDPWVAHFDAGTGTFYFEDTTCGQCVGVQPVPVPDGWMCRFDAVQRRWCFIHVASSKQFWDLDVGVLQMDGVVPAGCDLVAKDFVRASRRFAVRHHPDKGGDDVVFKQVYVRFERISRIFADMQGELVATWEPFWDDSCCEFAWRDLESDRVAWAAEELPDDAFEETEEEIIAAQQRVVLAERLRERERALANALVRDPPLSVPH